jgi:vacuolar-type H+-ATPase subunit E/Vma4
MALSDLLRRLEEEADARVAALLDAARAEAAGIAADAAARLSERYATARASREAALRAAAARASISARREATARVLAARDETLQRILSRMEQLLEARRGSEAVLARAGADLEAAVCYLDGPIRVRCRPELVTWVRDRLGAGARDAVQPDPEVGTGAVLRAADGSVEIDATMEQRLVRLRPELTVAAARMLGGSNGAVVG